MTLERALRVRRLSLWTGLARVRNGDPIRHPSRFCDSSRGGLIADNGRVKEVESVVAMNQTR